jgi:hypothetical protein
VSQNGQLLSRRGRVVPANASGVDTHRDSISSRFDCSAALGGAPGATLKLFGGAEVGEKTTATQQLRGALQRARSTMSAQVAPRSWYGWLHGMHEKFQWSEHFFKRRDDRALGVRYRARCVAACASCQSRMRCGDAASPLRDARPCHESEGWHYYH